MSTAVWISFVSFLPAVVAGLLIGRQCFTRVDEVLFRRFVIGLLLTVVLLALVA